MRAHVPSIHIPDAVISRLEGIVNQKAEGNCPVTAQVERTGDEPSDGLLVPETRCGVACWPNWHDRCDRRRVQSAGWALGGTEQAMRGWLATKIAPIALIEVRAP